MVNPQMFQHKCHLLKEPFSDQSIALATPPHGPRYLTILVISFTELQGVGVRGRVEMVGNMVDKVFGLGKILQGLQSQRRRSVRINLALDGRVLGLDHVALWTGGDADKISLF